MLGRSLNIDLSDVQYLIEVQLITIASVNTRAKSIALKVPPRGVTMTMHFASLSECNNWASDLRETILARIRATATQRPESPLLHRAAQAWGADVDLDDEEKR